jgi:Protein of unknown function, DUF488
VTETIVSIPTTESQSLADQLAGRVYTSRYQSSALIAASGAAPLRITFGPPRFRLGYELAGSIRSLAPRKRHFYLHGEAFREQYLSELDRRLGPDGVLELLAQAVEVHGDIVLLCFEDVLVGQACHRRMLADWLEQRSGLVIPELGAV